VAPNCAYLLKLPAGAYVRRHDLRRNLGAPSRKISALMMTRRLCSQRLSKTGAGRTSRARRGSATLGFRCTGAQSDARSRCRPATASTARSGTLRRALPPPAPSATRAAARHRARPVDRAAAHVTPRPRLALARWRWRRRWRPRRARRRGG
jgi:hypothetical protein